MIHTRAIFFFISVTVIASTVVSCRDQFAGNEKNFKRYLADVFGLELSRGNKAAFYVINVKECFDCIDRHFVAIRANKFESTTTLIIVGREIRSGWKEILDDVSAQGISILYDKKGEGIRFDFGLQKPVVLQFRDGRLVEFIRVPDNGIEKVIATL